MRAAKVIWLLVLTALIFRPVGAADLKTTTVPGGPTVQGGLESMADSAWDYTKARHLLFRAGFGGPLTEVEKLHAMGLRKAVEHLVDYRNQPDANVALPNLVIQDLEPAKFAQMTQAGRTKHLQTFDKKKVRNIQPVQTWWVSRMVQSPRPLEEKMVLFWHGLFATEQRTVRENRAMFLQNQLFRDHAVGNYGKLLMAIIQDPAMLRYLDNDANVKGKPNENLAREIMELFSMGEGQGYTEQDIKEAARALTGYSYNKQTLVPVFRSFMHDYETKTIFGQKGKWNGEDLVKLILKQPATPRFIARRLFTYFVHENPDEQTVDQLAKLLKDNNYELAPFLKTVFLSREFYSTRAMGTLIKSPAQFVAGTVRILEVKDTVPAILAHAMLTMNQELLEPPNVKGWDGGQAWLSTTAVFARNNFAGTLIAQGTPPVLKQPKAGKAIKVGKRPQALARGGDFVTALIDRKLTTPAEVVDYYTKVLLVVPLAEVRRSELISFLGQLPPTAQWNEQKATLNRKISELLVLIMSSPEYQLT